MSTNHRNFGFLASHLHTLELACYFTGYPGVPVLSFFQESVLDFLFRQSMCGRSAALNQVGNGLGQSLGSPATKLRFQHQRIKPKRQKRFFFISVGIDRGLPSVGDLEVLKRMKKDYALTIRRC